MWTDSILLNTIIWICLLPLGLFAIWLILILLNMLRHLYSRTPSVLGRKYIVLIMLVTGLLTATYYFDLAAMPTTITHQNILLTLGAVAIASFVLMMVGTTWGRGLIGAVLVIGGGILAVVLFVVWVFAPEKVEDMLSQADESSEIVYLEVLYDVDYQVIFYPEETRSFGERDHLSCIMFHVSDRTEKWSEHWLESDGKFYLVKNITMEKIVATFRRVPYGTMWKGMRCKRN